MADKLINIAEVSKLGIVKDTPAFALPPGAWSDGKNVRFHDGAVSKMPGEDNILQPLTDGESSPTAVVPVHTVYWPNPNTSQYVYTDKTDIYTMSSAGVIKKINKSGTNLLD